MRDALRGLVLIQSGTHNKAGVAVMYLGKLVELTDSESFYTTPFQRALYNDVWRPRNGYIASITRSSSIRMQPITLCAAGQRLM